MKLVALQMETIKDDFKKNFKKLKELILEQEEGTLILAPELCLTGFCYDRMDEASEFAEKIKRKIQKLSENKTIAISLIERQDLDYYNTLYIFHNKKTIHMQSKHKLFPLGDEPANFSSGKLDNMEIINLNGIKIGVLICFEIRFPEYWLKLRGADLILNPSMWGVKRKVHFETMTKALAVGNQCYVLTANSANATMAKGSGIITPWGDEIRDDKEEVITHTMDLAEVKSVRTYIDIGMKRL